METLGCSEKFDRNRDQPGRPLNFKILGLKKISSLQGLAGEVLTICKGQGQQSDRSAPPRGRSLLSNAMAVELGVSKGAKGMVE